MNLIKRFIKTATTFLVGNVLSKLVSFVLLPLYTKYLPPEVYGDYDLVITILNLIAPLAYFQIWDGVFRFSFDYDDANKKVFVINNGLFASLGGSIIYMIAMLIGGKFYPSLRPWYVIVYGLLLAFQYLYTVITRVYLNNKMFSLSGLINTLSTALINIVLIIRFNFGVESLYIAADIGLIIQIIFIELYMRPLSKFSFKDIDLKYIKRLITFSLPLCVSTVSYWLLNGYTKMVISYKLGTYDNGIYAVANKFTSLVILAVNVFQFAWNELVYLLANNNKKDRLYEKGCRMLFKGTVLASCIVLLFARIIFPFFVHGDYQGALSVLPVSIIGVAFNSYASFIGTIFLANKKSNTLLYTVIIAAALNAIAAPYFTRYYGLTGSIGMLSFSLCILAISRLFVLNRKFKIRLDIKSLSTVAILIAVMVMYYLQSHVLIDSLITLILVLIIGFYMKSEISMTIKLLKRGEKK